MNRCPECGWPIEGKVCQRCKLADYDCDAYMKYTSPAVIDKTLSTLQGILIGISIDSNLSEHEISELYSWCNTHAPLACKAPYNELFNAIFNAIEDDILTLDEKDSILWLCDRLQSGGLYYNTVTAGIQQLQGILHGILADGVITKEELDGLQDWLADHEHLASIYPYDEVYGLILGVLHDNVITPDEERLLKAFFSQFAEVPQTDMVLSKEDAEILTKQGVCAVDPQIDFENHIFCFTGKSTKATRTEIAHVVEEAGGTYKDTVVKKTNYLIVGNEGNPCWAFSCYGRKVEKAIELRKQGKQIVIVNELDFWDNL